MRNAVIALITLLCGAGLSQDQISSMKWEPSYVVAPQYPKLAFQARVSGRAIVEVQIAASGTVSNIVQFDGDKIFQKTSEAAAKAWVFQPSSAPNRRCRLVFVYSMMPTNTGPEDLTPRFRPPFEVEIRREIPQPTILVDPAPDPPKMQ